MKNLALSIAAIIAGYVVMVLLITLAQEVLFGGLSYNESGVFELLIGGFLTFLSAVAGGAVAAWIAGRAGLGHALAMSVLVAAETTALTVRGSLEGPLWFDILAAGSLMVGLLIGAMSVERRRV